MSAVTDRFVLVSKKKSRKSSAEEPAEALSGERIEFQAPHGFTAKVDSLARAKGLGRSAFLRMLVLEQEAREKAARKNEQE